MGRLGPLSVFQAVVLFGYESCDSNRCVHIEASTVPMNKVEDALTFCALKQTIDLASCIS